jgi:hypothetical protein
MVALVSSAISEATAAMFASPRLPVLTSIVFIV